VEKKMKSLSYRNNYSRVMLGVIALATFFLAACGDTAYPAAPPVVVEAPSVQIQVPAASRQESSEAVDCDLFKDINISVTYQDWMRDQPLIIDFNMPGGVPGLEKMIPNTSNTWEYSGKIGDYMTSSCEFVSSNPEKLSCKITLPAEYAGTAHAISLNLKGCEPPVYEDKAATVPGFSN